MLHLKQIIKPIELQRNAENKIELNENHVLRLIRTELHLITTWQMISVHINP